MGKYDEGPEQQTTFCVLYVEDILVESEEKVNEPSTMIFAPEYSISHQPYLEKLEWQQ